MPTADELETFARERQAADRRYNEALTRLDHAVASVVAHDTLDRAEVSHVATTLILFLQQITAFVETKDRELAAQMAERRQELAPAIESIDELRAQMAILQRTIHMLTRQRTAHAAASSPSEAAAPIPAPSPQPQASDVTYVGFEDRFRGSGEAIAERLRAYVPLFAGASNVLDLG